MLGINFDNVGESTYRATHIVTLQSIHMPSTWNLPGHIDIFKTIWQLNSIRKGASITWSSVHVLFTCNHHGRTNIIFMYSKTEVDWLPWLQSFFCHDSNFQELAHNQMDLAVKRSLIIANLLRLVLIFVLSNWYQIRMAMKHYKVLCYRFPFRHWPCMV